jgi:branched-chain amino acid transport system ATP-binding protein
MSLQIEDLDCFYDSVQVLRGFSLELRDGEVLCLLGHNGAGKSTLLKAVMGTLRPRAGKIRLGADDLARLPAHEIPKRGIAYVPQGRRLFSELTVAENLEIGLMTRRRGAETRERVLALFPALRPRLGQVAGTLSGGEQEMLAIGRALATEPRVLLLDEPTEGLMPSMIAAILDAIRSLRRDGVSTLLVEQRVETALAVADRVAFIEHGVAREVTTPAELRRDPSLLHRYVGVGLAKA